MVFSGEYYMLSDTGLQRLHKQFREHGKLVIAFDFDDTVYPYTWDYHPSTICLSRS